MEIREINIFKEKEPFESRIRLAFFRHGEKPSADLEDEDVEITNESKKDAMSCGKEVDFSQAIAFGGKAKRTQETAGFVLGGSKNELRGEEGLAELKAKLNNGLKVGTKLAMDPLLSFSFHEGSKVDRKLKEAITQGRSIQFLTEESDDLAIKLQDKEANTYLRTAAQIARLILKYVHIEERWNQLVKEKDYEPTMERYLGSHAIIGAFLAKIIERTKGKEELEHFKKILSHGHFDYLEGFTVDITNSPQGDPKNPDITCTYNKKADEGFYKFQETFRKDLLEKVIAEAKEFENKIDLS